MRVTFTSSLTGPLNSSSPAKNRKPSAAAQADDDFMRTPPCRIQKHLPNTERVRKIDILLAGLQASHSRRFTHFHHRQFFIFDVSVARFDFATERIVRLAFHP